METLHLYWLAVVAVAAVVGAVASRSSRRSRSRSRSRSNTTTEFPDVKADEVRSITLTIDTLARQTSEAGEASAEL